MLKWQMYTEVAEKMKRKVPDRERQDTRQEIITTLAEKAIQTEALAYLEANKIVVDWWRKERYRNSLYSKRMKSLDWIIFDKEGNPHKVIDTLEAFEHDLTELAFSKELLANMPVRLIKVASKHLAGYPMTRAEARYLQRWRKQNQQLRLQLA